MLDRLTLHFALPILGSLAMCSSGRCDDTKSLPFYIGTYTQGASRGIYRSQLDLATGALAPARLAGELQNPSFLAIHPSGRYLYAVSEVGDFGGAPSGAVAAFRILPEDGRLELLNQKPSQGAAPCHIVVDRSGRTALVANYGGGSVSAIRIGEDGSLGELSGFEQHQGKSVNSRRQEAPHAHSVRLDRDNRFAFVADLGLDKILIYRFDAATGGLQPADAATVAPGAGPRHFTFHPSGQYAYVINELDSTITAFRYDAQHGRLETLTAVATLPERFTGTSHTAEVVVHPSGRFLYGSNRGHDSIAVFRIDTETGQLARVEIEPTQGRTPRNFNVDPTGQFLLAENQDSGTIVVFRIDSETGELTSTGHVLEVPNPVCVQFITADAP